MRATPEWYHTVHGIRGSTYGAAGNEDEEGSVARSAVTDDSSRVNCLHPVSDKTAETALQRALISHMGTLGVPEQWLGDKGATVANMTVEELA
jgi:hypothetical protein